MPTVVARFEPSKRHPDRGVVYYRIYKGHNRRMEFSSRLSLPTASWDREARTAVGDSPEVCAARPRIEEDLGMLRGIIAEDTWDAMSMGDVVAEFKRRKAAERRK